MPTPEKKRSRVVAKNVIAIKSLKPEASRVHWRVKGEKGLCVTVHPSGEKTWAYRDQIGEGSCRKQVFKALGDYRVMSMDAAIDAADTLRVQVADDSDPNKPSRDTFDELFNKWLDQHAKKQLATWENEDNRYKLHMKAALGDLQFSAIERKHVREVRDEVAKKTPIQSNRVVALFNRVANWAVDEDLAKFNPAAKLKKVGVEDRRIRILTDAEFKLLWEELEKPLVVDRREPGKISKGGLTEADLPQAVAIRRALQLLMLTGQRRGEVIGIRKTELDLTAGDAWLKLPGERTKNSLPHEVPLCGMAVDVVKAAMLASGDSPFVFPSAGGDEPIIPAAVTKALVRICARLGIKKVVTRQAGPDGKGEKKEGVGPHAFRKTIGTALRRLHVPVEDRGHLFNHVSGAKSKVTSWNYDPGEHNTEKRAAINKWEREFRRVVGLDGDNVIPLLRTAGDRA